jgi:hypothetical protein
MNSKTRTLGIAAAICLVCGGGAIAWFVMHGAHSGKSCRELTADDRANAEAARAQAAKGSRSAESYFQQVERKFIPPPPAAEPVIHRTAKPVEEAPPPTQAVEIVAAAELPMEEQPPPHMSREEWFSSFSNRWYQMSLAQRTNFIARAKLSDEQEAHFDVLVAAMNIRLQSQLDPILDAYKTGWRPSPEERARLMASISSVLLLTYNEMDRSMPEDWRQNAPKDFSLTTFADPKYAPLMRGFQSRGPGGGPGGGPDGGPGGGRGH